MADLRDRLKPNVLPPARIALLIMAVVSILFAILKRSQNKSLHAVRGHWSVENGLHWVLDVAFDEDQSRVRKDHAPANLAVLRQMAVNLLKQEKSAKGGIKAKRLQAGWNEDYLLTVLSG